MATYFDKRHGLQAIERATDADPAGLSYEADSTRIRALYELPIAVAPNQVLELVAGTDPILPVTDWPTPVTVHDLSAAMASFSATKDDRSRLRPTRWLPFADESIDLVVMHKTFDSIASRMNAEDRAPFILLLLCELQRVTRARGIIAGCATNRYAALAHGLLRGRWRPRGVSGIRGYRDLFNRAGFDGLRLFTVFPDADSPRRLTTVERATSRAVSKAMLGTRRDFLSWAGYTARLVLVQLALDRWIADTLCFFATKR